MAKHPANTPVEGLTNPTPAVNAPESASAKKQWGGWKSQRGAPKPLGFKKALS